MNKALIPAPPSRGKLLRHLLVFQLKLAIDGLKDFVLAPISIGAGVFGFFFSKDPLTPLRTVLRMGRSFDEYVDLYSGIEGMDGKQANKGLDETLAKAERAVLEQQARAEKPLRAKEES